jgi:hypothetical protein
MEGRLSLMFVILTKGCSVSWLNWLMRSAVDAIHSCSYGGSPVSYAHSHEKWLIHQLIE